MTRRSRIAPALALVLLAASGCYQRVVDARGYGAAGTDVHQPNLSEPGKDRRTPIQRKPPKRMTSHE